MAFIVQKTFDWYEDLEKYKFYVIGGGELVKKYRYHKKLSWKGKFRKWLGTRETNQGD